VRKPLLRGFHEEEEGYLWLKVVSVTICLQNGFSNIYILFFFVFG
jgi:hypothetical protein